MSQQVLLLFENTQVHMYVVLQMKLAL